MLRIPFGSAEAFLAADLGSPPFTAQGQIVPSNTRLVSTITTSRQIQVALKLIF